MYSVLYIDPSLGLGIEKPSITPPRYVPESYIEEYWTTRAQRGYQSPDRGLASTELARWPGQGRPLGTCWIVLLRHTRSPCRLVRFSADVFMTQPGKVEPNHNTTWLARKKIRKVLLRKRRTKRKTKANADFSGPKGPWQRWWAFLNDLFPGARPSPPTVIHRHIYLHPTPFIELSLSPWPTNYGG